MTTVACVLRTGGCYDAEDVERLRDGVAEWLPSARFVCFSDVPVPCERITLRHDWPGWWAKLELFDPHSGEGDLLYFDLDTMFVGPLDTIAAVRGPAAMRDVYRPGGLQSSILRIPQGAKREIWNAFTVDPAAAMARHAVGGDQTFLEEHWLDKATRFQDVCPGQIVSYKVDGVKLGASVVVFHGRPKPRDIGWNIDKRVDIGGRRTIASAHAQ